MPAPQHTPRTYRALDLPSTSALTRVLSHQPPPSSTQYATYAAITRAQIAALPPRLLTNSKSSAASHKLCVLHRHLPPRLLRSIARWLRHELADKVPATLQPVAARHPAVPGLLATLRAPSAMFLSRERFAGAHGVAGDASGEAGGRWERQADGCVGCVLARVGGCTAVVEALRTAMVARMSEGKVAARGGSRRLEWVEAWIRCAAEAEGGAAREAEVMGRSERVGLQIKEVGRELRRRRRAEGRTEAPGSAGVADELIDALSAAIEGDDDAVSDSGSFYSTASWEREFEWERDEE